MLTSARSLAVEGVLKMAGGPIANALSGAGPRLARILVSVASAAIVALLLLGGVFRVLRNPWTPPGYVGYLTRGALLGQAQFYGPQTGPTSSGLGWLLDVTNVSVTP